MKKSLSRGLGIANRNIERLLVYAIGPIKAERALESMDFPSFLNDWESGSVTRSELVMALQLVLFDHLLMDSMDGRPALHEFVEKRERLCLHHSDLHTVRWRLNGALPPGEAAITRIIIPLGYRFAGIAEFDGMGTMKRTYVHEDHPDVLPRFVIGEILPERFSTNFQRVVTKVVASSTDPVAPWSIQHLSELDRDGVLPLTTAEHLLLSIAAAFRRQHQIASDSDCALLTSESMEMGLVARTGNAVGRVVGKLIAGTGMMDASFGQQLNGDGAECVFARSNSVGRGKSVASLVDDSFTIRVTSQSSLLHRR